MFDCTVKSDNAVNDVCQGLENIQTLHCIVGLLAAAKERDYSFGNAAKVSS